MTLDEQIEEKKKEIAELTGLIDKTNDQVREKMIELTKLVQQKVIETKTQSL